VLIHSPTYFLYKYGASMLKPSKEILYDLPKEDIHLVTYLTFNRDYKVKPELVVSMKRWGFVGSIICFKANLYGTNQIFIADGQNRISSAYALGLVPQVKIEKVTINSIRDAVEFVASLNTAQKRWTTLDFANAYSCLRIPEYMKIMELCKTTEFKLGSLASCLGGFRNSKQYASKTIKNGTFTAKYYDETLATIDFINTELGHFKIDGRLLVAIHYIRITKKFKKATFVQKFTCNYKKIILMKHDEYVDYFLSW
jgi:hypothetical protein